MYRHASRLPLSYKLEQYCTEREREREREGERVHPSAWELQQWNLYRRDAQPPDYLQRSQCNSHPRSRHVEGDAQVTHTYSATTYVRTRCVSLLS